MSGKCPEIIDAHIHLWDLDKIYYSWLTDQYIDEHPIGDYSPLCDRNYLIEDYLAESRYHGVSGAVHIQCALGHSDPVDETRWLQSVADKVRFPLQIVGSLNLDSESYEAELERHCAHSRFAGVRVFATPEDWDSNRFRQLLAAVEKRNLVFDLDADPDTIEDACGLVDAHPDLQFALGHAGFPKQRDGDYFRRWRAAMTSIGQRENVHCKISGLGMCDHNWSLGSIMPWVEHSLAAFGIDRCMFGTNWPVDSLFSDYGTVVATYLELLAAFSQNEQEAFFSGNSKRVYGFSARQ